MGAGPELGSRRRWPLAVAGALGLAILVAALTFGRSARRKETPAALGSSESGDRAANSRARARDNPAAPPAAAASGSKPAPQKPDRRRRDEMRTRVYEKLGQPAPTKDLREQPLPPSPVVLDKDYIRSRIRADFVPLASQCYEALLATQPSARGRAVFSFTIVGDESVGGIVESAELVEGTTLNDPEFATCVRESLLSVTFEPPAQGGWVTVTYPIDFSPDPPDAPRP